MRLVFKQLTRGAISGAIATLLGSCIPQPPLSLPPLFWHQDTPRLSGIGFDVRITPTQKPGVYNVTGGTPLPDKTPLRIVALRYLHPSTPANQALNPRPTYSILDYQPTQVHQGRWQATLHLWRVAPSGKYQEAWQLEQQKSHLPLKPDDKVLFLATVTSGPQSDVITTLQQELARQNKVLNSQQLRVTTDGQRYLQVSHDQAIALPTGGTTPPPLKPEDLNGGWGRRYLIPPEPKNPTRVELPNHRRTNAAPAEEEFLR